jgi:hypothetical protein
MPVAQQPLPVLLYLGLSLLDDLEEQERSWVEALPSAAGGIDGVLLALPSWQEVPDALNHELAHDARVLCRRHGLDVYHGRDLWIRWQPRSTYTQQRGDVFSVAYYVAYLSRLDAEATAIGAKGTFAECEPYGGTIFKPWFKSDGFTPDEFVQVLKAIGEARAVAPPTTLAYPAGGREPEHYSYALRYLGNQFLHSKTFEARFFGQLNATPPMFYPLQVNWWGSWLKATGEPGSGPLTVGEFRSLDWSAIRAEFPELQGAWIYTGSSDRVLVMHQLAEGKDSAVEGAEEKGK